MPTRTVVLTAVVAACVSSLVTLAGALLVLPRTAQTAMGPDSVLPFLRAEAIQARSIELVNSQGTVQARLIIARTPGPQEEYPLLEFRDAAGNRRLGLEALSAGAAVGLTDSTNTGRVILTAQLWPELNAGPLRGLLVGEGDQPKMRVFMGRSSGAPYLDYGVYVLGEAGEVVWQAP